MSLKLIAAAAFVAAPLLAQPAFAAPAAPADDHTGPIPYSDLAAVDAKMNMPMKKTMAKHHMKAKTTTTAAKTAPAAPAAAK